MATWKDGPNMAASRGTRPVFPLTALVGQERMKLALLLNAVNPRLGGVLIRGQKGTAKSTAVRALADLLPEITVVVGCRYGCDPDQPDAVCDDCADRLALGELLRPERRRAAVVDLPVGATEDRVVGTLDLERAIQEGTRHFEPGLLARANRGMLYVDEVNLLHDHLVDVLLDAAAMGRNYVEREGVSVSHPAEFLLVGTMNPEEGDLRPQLLDRFALMVDVEGLPDTTERAEVVRRRIAFDRDPAAFRRRWEASEAAQRDRVGRARTLLPAVVLADDLLELISQICAAFDVDGLRADIVMHRTATTLAAWAGRTRVSADDVRQAAELALPHRKRRQPFEQPDLDGDRLDDLMRQHEQRPEDTLGDDANGGSRDTSESEGDATPASTPPSSGPGPAEPSTTPGGGQPGTHGGSRPDQTLAPTGSYAVPPLESLSRQSRLSTRPPVGRRSTTRKEMEYGAYVGSRMPTGLPKQLALAPTIRAAAPYQRSRAAGLIAPHTGGAADLSVPSRRNRLLLHPADLRERVHSGRTSNLIVFVVDASGSMGAKDRMAATKGAILSLLLDAYRKRDHVGLVVFRGEHATVALPPTNSVDLAERLLATMPTGGRTPLADALAQTGAMVERAARQRDGGVPLVVVISDGRPNVALSAGNPFADAVTMARHLRGILSRLGGHALLIDTEQGRTRLGLAAEIATALDARYLRLDDLRRGDAPSVRAIDSSVRALLTPVAGARR